MAALERLGREDGVSQRGVSVTILVHGDMEGVSGVLSWEHTGGSSPLYEEGRRLYTAEINAAVRGLRAGGATRIVAQDGHGGAPSGAKPFLNWIPDLLEPGAEYVRGFRWGAYVELFEQGQCHAVAFVGAHAKAGDERGVLCHTVSADGWHSLTVNGVEVGESEVLAAIAGSFDVPVIAIAGDFAACEELRAVVGDGLLTVPVKWGLGRYAARCLAPADACARIEAGFAEAVRARDTWPPPLKYSSPVTIAVELASPDRAQSYASYSGVRRTGPRRVEASGRTFWEAWQRLWQP